MKERIKIQLTISKRAADVLNSAASERKRGDFVSQILEAYEAPDVSPVDIEVLRMQMIGLISVVKGLEARQSKLEAYHEQN